MQPSTLRPDTQEIFMKATFSVRFSVLVASIAALAASSGCSSGPDAVATASSMDRLTLEAAKVSDAIDQAVGALKALVGSGDNLKGSYDAFAQSVTTVEGQAGVVRERADELKARGAEYFKDWQEDSGTGLSQEKQAELNIGYARIQERMMAAKDAFTPFLASLKDIQTLLSLDLTAKGLQSVAPLVAKAQTNATEVKSRIQGAMDQINAVRGVLPAKPAS
jgi:hypothetical protein